MACRFFCFVLTSLSNCTEVRLLWDCHGVAVVLMFDSYRIDVEYPVVLPGDFSDLAVA